MPDIVIRCENLGKLYRIGENRERYRTLRDSIARAFTAPLKRFQKKDAADSTGKSTVWALRNVSFEVKRGEILGVIGRNGAGKSTLLKILTRITDPTEGCAEVRGRVASLLEVGTGFHPELTGRENIYLNGTILGLKRYELNKKFDEIVAFAEVEKFIETPVKFYSSGMYARLAFAVAAHLEPEILLIDEVLAVGDFEFQRRCFGRMGDISREGRTVLVVSHNMPVIINLCKRAIFLNQGEIASDGPATGVIQSYLSLARRAGREVVWKNFREAPGNDIVRLHAVRIFQEGIEGPTADVDISKRVTIQIQYWNLKEGACLYSAIWLRDQMGTPVLSSGTAPSVSLTEDRWYGRPHPIGLFESVCQIPGNFLNEGLYSVAAIVGKGVSDTQVLQDYALSFQVHDTGDMRNEFYGGWIGTVRPRLAWQTEYLGPSGVTSQNGN